MNCFAEEEKRFAQEANYSHALQLILMMFGDSV
jgi:hypothetical protein